jgi:hypothetical protein
MITLLCMRLCVPPNVARQPLGKHFPATTSTNTTVEELLDAVFYMRSVSYQILNI